MGIMSRLNPNAVQGTAPARVRDAIGRVLEVGDEVLIVNTSQLMRVATISPILAPGAPPSAMLLVLVAKAQLGVPRDTALENVYFLRHQAEIGDNAIQEPPAGTGADEAEGAPV
jgi:hypothetical protein